MMYWKGRSQWRQLRRIFNENFLNKKGETVKGMCSVLAYNVVEVFPLIAFNGCVVIQMRQFVDKGETFIKWNYRVGQLVCSFLPPFKGCFSKYRLSLTTLGINSWAQLQENKVCCTLLLVEAIKIVLALDVVQERLLDPPLNRLWSPRNWGALHRKFRSEMQILNVVFSFFGLYSVLRWPLSWIKSDCQTRTARLQSSTFWVITLDFFHCYSFQGGEDLATNSWVDIPKSMRTEGIFKVWVT